jgi:hypothetical protein
MNTDVFIMMVFCAHGGSFVQVGNLGQFILQSGQAGDLLQPIDQR